MNARDYLGGLQACLAMPLATYDGETCDLDHAVDAVVDIIEGCDTVHLIGNGGSASAVSHAHVDLIKACGYRANIYQDAALLTAYSNDNGYQNAYADALSAWLGGDDFVNVLIAVSSSGASPNILNAVKVAKAEGLDVITFSGFKPDNALRRLGVLNFYVPSYNYGYVELTHAALLHCLTDRLANAR